MPPLPRARRRALRRPGIVAQIETSCLPPSPPAGLEPSSQPGSATLALSAEPTPVLVAVQGAEESASYGPSNVRPTSDLRGNRLRSAVWEDACEPGWGARLCGQPTPRPGRASPLLRLCPIAGRAIGRP